MPFTLGDVENDVLNLLGSNNPPAAYAVGGGSSYPNWEAVVGQPRFDQGLIDNAVNRSVAKIISRVNDLQIVNFSYTFTSTAQVYGYAVPGGSVAQGQLVFTGNPAGAGVTLTITIGATTITYATQSTDTSLAQLVSHLISAINASAAVTGGTIVQVSIAPNTANTLIITAAASGLAGNSIALTGSSTSGTIVVTPSAATLIGGTASNPLIQQIRRVFYQPVGMNYRREKMPGARLLPWDEFQQLTAGGWLKPFSFAMEPDYCSLSPSRDTLEFFPGPASTGDLITLEYVPQMTTGTSEPLLTTQTSEVPLPDDFRDLVVHGAMVWMWPVAGEIGLRAESLKLFDLELARLRTDWANATAGEKMTIQDAATARLATGWGLLFG